MVHMGKEQQNERAAGHRSTHTHMPERELQTECSEDLPREAWLMWEGFLEKMGCMLSPHPH